LESVLGEGTTVRLFLPCHVPLPKAPALQQSPAWTGRGATVLVVEDEETVRALIVEELREQGHTVLEAADSHGGVQVLQSDARVDLLVTDVGLPGINGHELADAARVGRPSLNTVQLALLGVPAAADKPLVACCPTIWETA